MPWRARLDVLASPPEKTYRGGHTFPSPTPDLERAAHAPRLFGDPVHDRVGRGSRTACLARAPQFGGGHTRGALARVHGACQLVRPRCRRPAFLHDASWPPRACLARILTVAHLLAVA